jgi:hypothetical protein
MHLVLVDHAELGDPALSLVVLVRLVHPRQGGRGFGCVDSIPSAHAMAAVAESNAPTTSAISDRLFTTRTKTVTAASSPGNYLGTAT